MCLASIQEENSKSKDHLWNFNISYLKTALLHFLLFLGIFFFSSNELLCVGLELLEVIRSIVAGGVAFIDERAAAMATAAAVLLLQ